MPVSSPTETDFSMAYTKQRSLEEKEENDRVLIGEGMLRSSSLPHLHQSQDVTTDVCRSTNRIRCFHHPGRFVISKKKWCPTCPLGCRQHACLSRWMILFDLIASSSLISNWNDDLFACVWSRSIKWKSWTRNDYTFVSSSSSYVHHHRFLN